MPTPSPTSLATLPMPMPLANSCRRARSCPAPPLAGPASSAPLPALLIIAVAGELLLDDVQPSPHPLADHRPLEFREGAGQLEEELASWRGGVDRLLIQVKVDANGFKVLGSCHRSMSDRLSRSMAQAITTSNLRRLASLSRALSPGRWSRPLAPLMPVSR